MTILLSSALALLWTSSVRGQEPFGKSDKGFFESKIRPILATHCFSCHSKEAEKPKGNFRLDQLSLDFANGENREAWLAVVNNGKIQKWQVYADNKPVYDILSGIKKIS